MLLALNSCMPHCSLTTLSHRVVHGDGGATTGLNASATAAALDLSLSQLKVQYVDLMLLHWPGGSWKSPQAGRQAQARVVACCCLECRRSWWLACAIFYAQSMRVRGAAGTY